MAVGSLVTGSCSETLTAEGAALVNALAAALATQVLSGGIPASHLIGYANFAALKAESAPVANGVYFALGGSTFADGLQGYYGYNPVSTNADDGYSYLQPDVIPVGSPGRFVRLTT